MSSVSEGCRASVDDVVSRATTYAVPHAARFSRCFPRLFIVPPGYSGSR